MKRLVFLCVLFNFIIEASSKNLTSYVNLKGVEVFVLEHEGKEKVSGIKCDGIPDTLGLFRFIKALESTLANYDRPILSAYLKKVYFSSAVYSRKGIESGIASPKENSIFLSIPVYTDENINTFQSVVHHEINHVLLYYHSEEFDKRTWKNLNKRKYCYFRLKTFNKSSRSFDSKLIDHGFVTPYSTTCFVEDVASFAEYLFVKNEDFSKIVSSNLLIRDKWIILTNFYAEIFPKIKYINYVSG